ncbi:MAG: xanthine dehydrogenase family protein molybdopterin-binding subunit [Myxococcota bacterium]|nr:xanthine dehydrogenase family protein molybdopterin-binding subunit [Myxococcota bacterium]
MSERKFKYVGTRPIRHDGVEKVTGRANYGADVVLPGMLQGAIARSEHAHARILSIDTSKAEALEGVKAVVTAADFPDIPCEWKGGAAGGTDFGELSRNIMARDKVLYHGHALAAVAAVSPEIAREACKRIEVNYEVLEPVMSLDAALAPGAPILHPDQEPMGIESEGPTNVTNRLAFEGGDLDAGFADADVVIEREFTTPMVHQGYIEPHACTVRFNEDGKYSIWCSTQGPFSVQMSSAIVLAIEPNLVKCTPTEIGGGFGGKTTIYLEPVAMLLARKSGRPVRIVMSREEVFRASGPTSGGRVRMKLGAKRDGRFVAGDCEIWLEAGAFRGSPAGAAAMTGLSSYTFPNFRIQGYDVVVNKPKVAAYRAPGAPISNFAVESCVDEMARELRIDPIELRLRNAVQEGDRAPYGPTFKAIGLRDTLEQARNHPHYKTPLGESQGRGVACGFWFNAGMQSSAIVSVNTDGSAVVRTGNPDIGGSRVSLAMMAAEELGIPVERVRPVVGDTESVGYTDLTGGSRVTFATGMAVIEAAQDAVQQLRERAAKIWGVDAKDVKWEDGIAHGCNGAADQDPMPLKVLAPKLGATGGPVVGRAQVNPAAAGPGFATHICDIEVDPETGRSQVIRYTTIQDAGKAVHPSYVEGQMQGGAVQGIGWALNEEYLWDDDGVIENPGFLDYRMPVASDVPMIDTVIVEVPNPTHPYGVRGVGETPIVPPLAAVANAMRAATGVRFEQLPMSPPRVLEAIDRNGR